MRIERGMTMRTGKMRKRRTAAAKRLAALGLSFVLTLTYTPAVFAGDQEADNMVRLAEASAADRVTDEQVAQAKADMEAAEAELAEAQSKADQAKNAYDTAKARADEANAALEEAREAKESAEKARDDEVAQIREEAADALAAADKALADAQDEKKAADDAVAAAQSDLDQTNQEIADAKNEIADLEKQKEDAQKEVNSLTGEVADAKSSLDQANARWKADQEAADQAVEDAQAAYDEAGYLFINNKIDALGSEFYTIPEMIEICKGVEVFSGCKIDCNYTFGYDAVINDDHLVDVLTEDWTASMGEDFWYTMEKPQTFSEDYSFYSTKTGKPSAMFFLNAGHMRDLATLHNAKCSFNEDCIPYGMTAMCHAALAFLADK